MHENLFDELAGLRALSDWKRYCEERGYRFSTRLLQRAAEAPQKTRRQTLAVKMAHEFKMKRMANATQ